MTDPKPALKYVLYPGLVTSKSDGQVCHVTAAKLAMLYGVPLDQCFIYPSGNLHHSETNALKLRTKNMIALRPRFDGNYTLPKA
jgi:hypothetical protein